MTDPVYQGPPPPTAPAPEAASNNPDRVKAARFSNPGTTIPQGAVIQAVLETALDSTRPGPARALVSRDVRSFDGSKILIPRGSRLFGEYKADLTQGQNRAFIQWQTAVLSVEVPDMQARHVYLGRQVLSNDRVAVQLQDLGERPDHGLSLGLEGANRKYHPVTF